MTDIAVSRLSVIGEHFDTTTPAFGIRVGKHRKTWFVIRGKERQRTNVGRYPDMSLADARKEARKLLTEAPKKHDRLTFAEAYELYKPVIEALKPRTQRDYKRVLEKHLSPKLGKKKLGELEYEDIIAIADKLSKSERRHCLAVARTFFKWCVKPPQRYIPHSPLEGVVVKAGGKRKRILKDDELRQVWRGAEKQGYPHGMLIQLLILNGQRRGEIANLRWPWINEKERTITLPEWVTKNSKEHTFPYGQMVADILANIPRLNSTDLLFPSRASLERPISGFSKFKKELDELSGVSGHTLHDLRRTFRSKHGQIGTPREIAERLINHAAGVQTEVEAIYDVYTYLPEMRAATERYQEHLHTLLAA